MAAAFRIVVGIPLVQVETEEPPATVTYCEGKTGNHCGNQRSLPEGIEENFALDGRIFFAALQFCAGFRFIEKQHTGSLLHKPLHWLVQSHFFGGQQTGASKLGLKA